MRYGEYKETPEAVWFSAIPSTWRATKMRELFSERNEKVSDKDFAPLSIGKMGVVPQLDTAVKTDNGDNRKLIREGDFAINSRSDRKGSCGISKFDGSCSLIITVLKPHNNMSGRYVHYLLRSHYFSEEFYRNGHGLVADLWTTKWDEMRNIYIPVPPREEQEQIVRYLDWKVSKINKLIHGYQRQIKLLEEIRNSQIKRIISSYPIERYIQLKYLGEFSKGGGFSRDNLLECDGYPAVLYGDIYTQYRFTTERIAHLIDKEAYQKACKIKCGDIVFAGTGETKDEIGKPILYTGNQTVAIGGDVISFRNTSDIDSRFLLYYLYTDDALKHRYVNGKGDIIVHISASALGNQIITIPNAQDISEIVIRIEKIITYTAQNIAGIKKEISLLTEYRTRLISDVVTGQIDVRGIEVPDYIPEEDIDETVEENKDAEVDTDAESDQ